MNLDDLRRLNFRDIGNWPMLPKALALGVLFIAILGAGALFDWNDQYEALDRAKQEEGKLKEQYAQKKAKAINFQLYVQQLSEIEQEVLLMRTVEGLSNQEVAQILDIAPATASKRYGRALLGLRQTLAQITGSNG